MPPFSYNPRINFLQQVAETEFDVSTEDFASLEIRSSGSFYYFYDASSNRLIKDFVLRRGRQVDTMVGVFLTKKDEIFIPRLTFWKKDKAKGTQGALTESELVAQGRTVLIKARVDIGDCHENFWKLIDFFRTCREVELPESEFRITGKDSLDLVKTFEGHDKETILAAVKTYLDGQLTEQDVQMLFNRRRALETFRKLMADDAFFVSEKGRLKVVNSEAVWQAFFEENTWIFGYGLTLLACEKYGEDKLEQVTSGWNTFMGGGKRSDALMRTKGFLQTLLFAEIKKHDTPLLMTQQYRKPDVYQVSRELSGAVSQVQKTAYKAVSSLGALHASRTPEGAFEFEISTIRPRQIVIIGNLAQLTDGKSINVEKMTTFELYRRDHQEVEILTFDELYERSRYIVEHHEEKQSDTDR